MNFTTCTNSHAHLWHPLAITVLQITSVRSIWHSAARLHFRLSATAHACSRQEFHRPWFSSSKTFSSRKPRHTTGRKIETMKLELTWTDSYASCCNITTEQCSKILLLCLPDHWHCEVIDKKIHSLRLARDRPCLYNPVTCSHRQHKHPQSNITNSLHWFPLPNLSVALLPCLLCPKGWNRQQISLPEKNVIIQARTILLKIHRVTYSYAI